MYRIRPWNLRAGSRTLGARLPGLDPHPRRGPIGRDAPDVAEILVPPWAGAFAAEPGDDVGHGVRMADDKGRQRGGADAGDMIEMADLEERVRKLETIASCIDL